MRLFVFPIIIPELLLINTKISQYVLSAASEHPPQHKTPHFLFWASLETPPQHKTPHFLF